MWEGQRASEKAQSVCEGSEATLALHDHLINAWQKRALAALGLA
jgi:hypothetical protein